MILLRMFNSILFMVFIAAVMVIPKTMTSPPSMGKSIEKAIEKINKQSGGENCKQTGQICHPLLPCCQGLSCKQLMMHGYCS